MSTSRPFRLGALLALAGVAAFCWVVFCNGQPRREDPLPSWNDRPVKRAILDFVARVTREDGPDYVAAERCERFPSPRNTNPPHHPAEWLGIRGLRRFVEHIRFW
jgi:hypothetical protein